MAGVLESLIVKLALDGADYDEGIKKASTGLDTFADNAGKVGGAMSLAVTAPILAIGAAGLSAASDLSETVSKVNTLFGDQATAIDAWASDSAAAFGLSKQAALDSVGTMGNMFMQLGSGNAEAAAMSQAMVGLSADIASFHNVAGGSEQVLGAMTSAFRGEYDALQAYIPTINAAAVEHAALAATGKESASELTNLEKAMAVQTLIMEGAGAAVGDYARTSEGLANTQRTMQAELANVSAELGEVLLPIALEVAQGLKGLLTWFSELSPETKKWVVVVAGAAAAIGPLLVGLAGVASAIGTMITVATAAAPVIAAIGTGLAALAAPITIVIAAVAALALAWTTDFLGVRTKTEEFGNWITSNWPRWVGGMKDAWQGFSDWWGQDNETKIADVKSGWNTFWGDIGSKANTQLNTIKGYWQSHQTEVQNIQQNQWQTLGMLVTTTVGTIQGVIRGALQIVQGDWSGGFTTLQTTAQGALNGIQSIFNTQLDTIKNLFSFFGWAEAGEAIVQGIADGIDAGLHWITDAARDAAQEALDAAKWILGINSPAKVPAREVGVPFSQGVGLGVSDEMDNTTGRIQGAINSMVDSLSVPQLGIGAAGAGAGININITLSGAATYEDGRAVGAGVNDELRARGLI